MVFAVSNDNENIWAKLCVDLWPDNSVESFLQQRAKGLFKYEFLYYVEEKAVAFLSLSKRNDYVEGTKSSPVGYIEGIYVLPEFRKIGIAKELVVYAKNWSLENGYTELASDCEIQNETSRLFHNKVGFNESSTNVHFTMCLDPKY